MTKFLVELGLKAGADPVEVADWVLELLTSQDDDAPYESCDAVDPVWERS